MLAGAAELPDAAVGAAGAFEFDFGRALAGVAAHHLFRPAGAVAGGAAVEGQCQGVKDGGFASAGGAYDGEESGAREGGGGEVEDGRRAAQGVQVIEAEAEDSHAVAFSCM